MKLLVECECDISTMLSSSGMACDSLDLTIEAASPKIAEYCALSKYPGVLQCKATIISLSKQESREEIKDVCRVLGCALLITVFLFLTMDGHSGVERIGHETLKLGAYFIGSLLGIYFAFVLSFLLQMKKHEREADAEALERECYRRLGYRCGWHDCEKGRTPLFADWDKEEALGGWSVPPGLRVEASGLSQDRTEQTRQKEA